MNPPKIIKQQSSRKAVNVVQQTSVVKQIKVQPVGFYCTTWVFLYGAHLPVGQLHPGLGISDQKKAFKSPENLY